jgi:hypothetical protein
MALSQTSLDIEDLTVATLFNRGSVLSTFQQYVPILSSIGGFNVWTNQPVSNIFNNVFYGYSNGSAFQSSIGIINEQTNILSSSAQYNTNTVSTFSNTNYGNLIALSNIDISTINSFNDIYNSNSTIVVSEYSTISEYYSQITPGISTTASTFYNKLFSPTASTFISIGYYYYVPPPNIQSATGIAPRYIGPGLSTLYSNSINPTMPFYNNVTTNFLNTLINTESGWVSSNANIDIYRNNLEIAVYNTSNFIDTGSSISTLFKVSNSTFQSTLNSASTYGSYVSSISTYATLYINNVKVPTVNGYSMSSIVNTASTTISFNISTLSRALNSSMVSSVLLIPLRVFSSIEIAGIIGSYSTLINNNSLPGLFLIQSSLNNTLLPFYAPLNISTNLLGYQRLSSMEANMFSTFSTNFPSIVGGDILNDLSTINIITSSLSTSITSDASTLYGTIVPNITGPGISSFYNDLSTNTSVSFIDYSHRVSSIILAFSNALKCVDSSPGLSSINISAELYDTDIQVITTGIQNNLLQFSDTYSTNIGSFSSLVSYVINYTNSYISAGVLAFSTLSTVFTSVSSAALFDIKYISLLTAAPDINGNSGQLYSNLNSSSNILSSLSNVIKPYQGSTIYYPMLPLIADYSTSRYVYPNTPNPAQYILRSTIFTDIYTSTIKHAASSFNMTGPLNIESSNSDFNLNILGSARIIPYQGQTLTPSIDLNNIDIYTQDSIIIPILIIQFQCAIQQ